MIDTVLRCCDNEPKFDIVFLTNDRYFVCSNCCQLDFWSRFIKEKKELIHEK